MKQWASMSVFASGGNCKIHGPRSLRVQDELGECWVLQADRCLLHGSGALGDDVSLQCGGRYVRTPSWLHVPSHWCHVICFQHEIRVAEESTPRWEPSWDVVGHSHPSRIWNYAKKPASLSWKSVSGAQSFLSPFVKYHSFSWCSFPQIFQYLASDEH